MVIVVSLSSKPLKFCVILRTLCEIQCTQAGPGLIIFSFSILSSYIFSLAGSLPDAQRAAEVHHDRRRCVRHRSGVLQAEGIPAAGAAAGSQGLLPRGQKQTPRSGELAETRGLQGGEIELALERSDHFGTVHPSEMSSFFGFGRSLSASMLGRRCE